VSLALGPSPMIPGSRSVSPRASAHSLRRTRSMTVFNLSDAVAPLAVVLIYAAAILVLFPQVRRIARKGVAFVAERRTTP
jgi:hypothetical protein